MPYSQRSPGSNIRGALKLAFLHFADERSSGDLLKLHHRLTPDAVGKTCSVSEEMAQRDCSFGGAKLRCAAGVDPLEHLGLLQLRKHLAHRLIELQLALLELLPV